MPSSAISPDRPHLHASPTRRSSDLSHPAPREYQTRSKRDHHRSAAVHTSDRAPAARSGDRVRNCPDSEVPHQARGHSIQGLGEYPPRSEEHTSELQSRGHLVCRLLLSHLTAHTYTLPLHDALPIYLIQLLGSIKRVVSVTIIDQLLCILLIELLPLALAIGSVIARILRSLIRLEATPYKGSVNIRLRLLNISAPVSVLDPEDKGASLRSCVEIVVEGGSKPSDMEKTSWRGCKTDSDLGCHRIYCRLELMGRICKIRGMPNEG